MSGPADDLLRSFIEGEIIPDDETIEQTATDLDKCFAAGDAGASIDLSQEALDVIVSARVNKERIRSATRQMEAVHLSKSNGAMKPGDEEGEGT